jgi:MFS family permease
VAVAAGERHPSLRTRSVNEHSLALAHEWKKLGRLATAVALLTSPILYAAIATSFAWDWHWCALASLAAVVIFRGMVDVLAHRFIPSPAIYGAESALAKDDVISRRRLWYWRKKFRRTFFWGSLFLVVSLLVSILQGDGMRAAMEDVLTAIPEFLASA